MLPLDGHADDETHGIQLEVGGVFIGFRPNLIFVVSEHNYTSLGTMWVHHPIWFDGKDTHGRICMGGHLFHEYCTGVIVLYVSIAIIPSFSS